MAEKSTQEVIIYPKVIENIEDWPIYRLSQDREQFIQSINEHTVQKLLNRHKKDLADALMKIIYDELIRIKEKQWRVDPPNEASFWKKISKTLIKKSLDRDENDLEAQKAALEVLHKIVHRYSEEIVGTFQIPTFLFARRFLTVFFGRLLNAAETKTLTGLLRGKSRLYERLKVVGEVKTVHSIFNKGTVVVVPTHFSNLDSILVGYAMDQIMGLPSFSYGAGLNLYNFGPAAYYMNRLGAYRVDRRKKNEVYHETLKTMSALSILRGVNSLFFPGGTRSRSGALETDLKMGLLSTTIEAQRAMCQSGSNRKVFIVPMVISYNFVLEAPFMAEDYLRSTGKENYLFLKKDEGASPRSWFKFIWRLFSTSSDITISVGKPMDVLGNFVDEQGRSFDRFGNEIDISEYFKSPKNEINTDQQREQEYTKLLAEKIIERYHRENVVLPSHLVAFAVFELLEFQHSRLDLYGILRLPPGDFVFDFDTVQDGVEQLLEILKKWEAEGKIKLAPEMHLPAREVIHLGVKNLGIYHNDMPLRFNRQGNIISDSFRTLFYYHNRLENYGLDKMVRWQHKELELATDE